MHKDELIQVHTLLCQLKNELEAKGSSDDLFNEYTSLGVKPVHVHRSKTEHKRAIFVLGKELARAISSGEWSGPQLVSHHFESMETRLARGRAL